MASYIQSTAYTREFVLVQSLDHNTPLTGATGILVKLVKAGATGVTAGGTVSEVDATNAPGHYKIALTTTDTNTLGDLGFAISVTGADRCDFIDQVIVAPATAANVAAAILVTPAQKVVTDASGFVTYSNTAPPTAATVANLVWDTTTAAHTTAGTFGAASSPSAATIAAAVWDLAVAGHNTAGTFGNSVQNASGLTATGILDTALSGHTTAGTVGGSLNTLIASLTEAYATNGSPATIAQLLYSIFALLANVSQSGNTLTATKLDGSTPAMTFTYAPDSTNPTSRKRAT